MNDGHSNGGNHLLGHGHTILESVNGVLRYEHGKSKSGSGKVGTLCLCRYGISLTLLDSNDSSECQHSHNETDFFSPLPNIKSIFLVQDGKSTDLFEHESFEVVQPEKIVFQCKDFREFLLHFPKNAHFTGFLSQLHKLLYQKSSWEEQSTGFLISTSSISSFLDQQSWDAEVKRLKLNLRKTKWKVHENKNFSSCGVLSQFVVVPNAVRAESLEEYAKSHTNNRFMSWCWTDNETMVSLLRCSEPQTILNNSYLNKILGTVNNGRAKTHAVLSTARLKESCPSEEAISASYEKLWSACLVKDSEHFYRNLESSKWLHYIQALIRASRHIARTLKCDKNPVVVIDASGRDISCLVVSLVLILCDRHYRTISGFANLINKEWVSAGYAFRSSLISVTGEQSTFLPTFVMFMDCVQNIIRQYPGEFEFTDMYPITILDRVLRVDCQLFMYDCPQDINREHGEKENLVVLRFWAAVLESKSEFSNPVFNLKERIMRSPTPRASFDEESHRARTSSYLYAVTKGFEVSNSNSNDSKSNKRRSTLMPFKSIKKPSISLFHRSSRKKSKKSKEKSSKVGSSSFFRDCESPRERLSSIKNIFKSKFDPINVNYSLMYIALWDRYFFRYAENLYEDLEQSERLAAKFVHDTTKYCSSYFASQCSDDSSDHDEISSADGMRSSLPDSELHASLTGSIQRSDSQTTIASDRMERSIHVSEIDLCNDLVDRDYESAEELSLNGLTLESSGEVGPISEEEKRLSHVAEEPEMSNSKSAHVVELEIAEATNDC